MPPAAAYRRNRRISVLEFVLLTVVWGLLLGACNGRARVPSALTIAYTGNFRGFQRPCGCVARQDGGLPRLGPVLDYAKANLNGEEVELPRDAGDPPPAELTRPQDLVFVECGNFTAAGQPLGEVKAATHLRVLAQLGAKAAILGGEELALTAEQARTAFGDSPVPLVSCNVESGVDGVEVLPSIELAPGWVLIGITIPRPSQRDTPEAPPWGTIRESVAAVKAVLDTLPDGTQAILAAAQVSPAMALQLGQLPVAGVIGVTQGQFPDDSAPRLPPPVYRGQQLTFASLSADAGKLSAAPWSLALSPHWPDSEEVMAELRRGEQQQRTAAKVDPDAWKNTDWGMSEAYKPVQEGPDPDEPRYSGSMACRECHEQDYLTWRETKHRVSYITLIEHEEAQTLDCLACHVTGLFRPGGFDPDKSPDVLHDPLAAVGCESCHGPSSLHVEAAKKLRPGPVTGGTQRSSVAACIACHDEYNSPTFEPVSFWDHVKH